MRQMVQVLTLYRKFAQKSRRNFGLDLGPPLKPKFASRLCQKTLIVSRNCLTRKNERGTLANKDIAELTGKNWHNYTNLE